MSEPSGYPLYNSTFTTYRTSPLYHGDASLLTNLDLHARRLREVLAGDALRTAQLGGLYMPSGSLESCTWKLLGDEDAWERAQERIAEGGEAAQLSTAEVRGIAVEVRYEKATHSAILLGEANKTTITPGFTSMPLLLVRMPAPLRELFLNYLSTSFDTRISPMKLRSFFLTNMLEKIIDQTQYSSQDEDPSLSLAALKKGVGIQLAFPSVVPHLKNLDISIASNDIPTFIARGKPLWQQHQAQVNQTMARPASPITGPFTSSLSAYLHNNVALTLDHPCVVVSKIVTGPFALAGEGKLKVTSTSSAALLFWDALIQEARRTGFDALTKAAGDSTILEDTAVTRTLTRDSSSSTEPPPPYELHDPARQ
jgi:hypothetical protein